MNILNAERISTANANANGKIMRSTATSREWEGRGVWQGVIEEKVCRRDGDGEEAERKLQLGLCLRPDNANPIGKGA